ncbi:unnamed protein product, partial [Owenia fusiformis]
MALSLHQLRLAIIQVAIANADQSTDWRILIAKLQIHRVQPENAILWAVENNVDLDTDTLTLLIRAGADINASNFNEITSLMLAIKKSNVNNAIELLEHGADVDAIDDCGKTALIHAIEGGNLDLECVSVLLKKGVDLNIRDHDGKNALDYAILETIYKITLERIENFEMDLKL